MMYISTSDTSMCVIVSTNTSFFGRTRAKVVMVWRDWILHIRSTVDLDGSVWPQ